MPLARQPYSQYKGEFSIRPMALSSKKQIPGKKTASNNKEGLVPIRFIIDASLYAFLEDIAKRSGKRVSAIISMYLTAAVDKNTKIEPCIARAVQQIVAEDI